MRVASIPPGSRALPSWRWGGFLVIAALANVAVAVALGTGKAVAAVPLALLPIMFLAFGALLTRHRVVLALAALALSFTGLSFLDGPLPMGGGIAIYATDLILILAVGAWMAERLTGRERQRAPHPLPLVVTWPLLALAIITSLAVVRGHEQFGTTLFGQPVRLIIYAGIAAALTDATAPALWRGITIVFYAGAVVQFFYALFHLAFGGSQTGSLALSTGGTRILALTSSLYLVGSLVCALLNLERSGERFSRQIGHVGIACLAFFGIVVSFGRTIYLATAVILVALFLTRKALRHSVALLLPLLLPALIVAILLIPVLAPTLAPTLTSRIAAAPSTDINVEFRNRGREVALAGIDQHLLTGFGFGRPVRFVFLGSVRDLTGDPHNSYVYVLVGGGLLALGALLAVMLAFVYDLLRRLSRAVGVEQSLLIWSLCFWFTLMLNALAEPILTNATLLMTIWVLMLIPWSVPLRSGGPATEATTAPQPTGSTLGEPVNVRASARS